MSEARGGYQHILAATDFSTYSDAAVKLGLWLADQSQGALVLAHVLANIREAVEDTSYKARMEFFYGDVDVFERDVRRQADERLKGLVAALGRPEIHYETLLGEPFVEIIHAVQQEGHDLVMCGTKGLSAWGRFLIGSTAKRLIRKCPSSVWVVKREHATPPRVILAATDLSEISRRAVAEAMWVAGRSEADLYVLHVVDSHDVPPDVLERVPEGEQRQSMRRRIRSEAKQRFEAFLGALPAGTVKIRPLLSWGTPWREIQRVAKRRQAELVALGTVGRSGIKGLLLGNTAEKVLTTCDASILTVKPIDFVSPIQPPFWPLHPGSEEN